MSLACPQMFVADLDRFLIDTGLVMDVFEDACIKEGLDSGGLEFERQQVEANGGSYNPWDWIRSHGSGELAEAIASRFIGDCVERPVTYRDTQDFLDFLSSTAMPYMILTSGGTEWQEIKLEAAALEEHPHLVTLDFSKGRIINGWKTGDVYTPPRSVLDVAADSVLLGDDKVQSFEDLPADCGGYLLQRPGERRLVSQAGFLPPKVKIVKSLGEIIDSLGAEELA